VLPHVLEYSIGPAEKRMSDMAKMIGLEGRDDAARARAFLDAVRALARDVGIPSTLGALQAKDIPMIARDALTEAHMNYPVPRYMETQDCEHLVSLLLERT
jgi:alcohol dehydrogenase class IV